jgi:K+-transporting ATPase ATPase A chain
MTQGFLQIAVFCAILIAVVPLLGAYMARVFQGERVFLTPVVAPVERGLYRVFRVDPEQGQDWKAWAFPAGLLRAVRRPAVRDPAHAGHPPVQPG